MLLITCGRQSSEGEKDDGVHTHVFTGNGGLQKKTWFYAMLPAIFANKRLMRFLNIVPNLN